MGPLGSGVLHRPATDRTRGELQGQVAVITGAAQGMGRAVAERFAAEGATLVMLDVQADALQALASSLGERGAKASARVLDISSAEQVTTVISDVIAELGRIDVLINAAGILHPTRFDEMSIAEWDRVIGINLRGTFLPMHAVYPHMKARGRGSIVNFSSTAGLTVSTLGGAHYTASKHGVMGLTKALAREGGPFGVRVNAVCPGLIDTEMVRATIAPDRIRRYEAGFPISRLGTPDEVAEVVLFLASDRSAYITGVSLNISGGDFL
jgi:NAD(P)-dependent dehydrogenase (short-subunit alcohol dehydrogenase family)